MKIGILTHPLETNYGGLFQAFALQYVLRQMGHDAVTIDRHNKTYNYSNIFQHILGFSKRWFQNRVQHKQVSPLWNAELSSEEYNIIADEMVEFVKKNIVTTRYVLSSNLAEIDSEYLFEAYVVGSDQVWLPGFSLNSFLNFVKRDDVIRIFYAASSGKTTFADIPSISNECRRLASKFNAISVREKQLCNLSKEVLGCDAKWVLDPTLLVSSGDYVKLVDEDKRKTTSPIVFSYILDSTLEKEKFVKFISKSLTLPTEKGNVEKYFLKDGHSNPEDYVFPSPENWIWNMHRSQFVVTDSFHGMAMSIVFNKQFVVVANKERGIERFISLLDLLGLQSRVVSSEQDLADALKKPIDYKQVNSILSNMREQSLSFLKSNLPL